MLKRGDVEDHIRLEFMHQLQDTVPVADVGNPTVDCAASFASDQPFDYGIKRRFGIPDHQQSGGAKREDAVANLRTNGAAVTRTALRFTRCSRRG